MCGIAGLIRHDGASVDGRLLDAMGDALAHRGPDGRGSWVGTGVTRAHGLAHRRLSIIDLQGSAQPMVSADARYAITFNGEILNYRELRRALDYPWRTNGDTEVLLAAFAQHGPRAFELLAGQFACAVVDTLTGDLWLARDRLGILPLYWTDDGVHFAFASEPKALAVVTGRFDVDPQGLDDYLMRRFVPMPRTLYAGVSKFPASCYARVRPGGAPEIHSYWDLAPATPASSPRRTRGTRRDDVSHLDEALRTAVRRALVGDVEVGAYLSGGLDSSLITALTVASRPGDVATHTFSAGFGDARVDELPYARAVAQRLGTVHHEIHVREDDFVDLWPRLAWHRDAPLSEAADVAVFRLAQAAREHVKVILSGEGSDELFAGYPKHSYAGLTAALARVPAPLRASLFELLARGAPASQQRLAIALRAMAGRSIEDMYAGWFASFSPAELGRLTGRSAAFSAAEPLRETDSLTRMLVQDCQAWLSDNLLERGDRMSMAASLELRPPFLDRDVVDLAFSVPPGVKIYKGRRKWIVKEVARQYLPQDIVDRRKTGFRVPLDAWFRAGLRDLAWDGLTDPAALSSTRLDPAVVRGLLQEHDSGRRNHEMRLWTLLSLEIWYRACLRDGRPAEPSRVPELRVVSKDRVVPAPRSDGWPLPDGDRGGASDLPLARPDGEVELRCTAHAPSREEGSPGPAEGDRRSRRGWRGWWRSLLVAVGLGQARHGAVEREVTLCVSPSS